MLKNFLPLTYSRQWGDNVFAMARKEASYCSKMDKEIALQYESRANNEKRHVSMALVLSRAQFRESRSFRVTKFERNPSVTSNSSPTEWQTEG